MRFNPVNPYPPIIAIALTFFLAGFLTQSIARAQNQEFCGTNNGGNGDGLIDSRDAVFSSLRLWRDTNHNAVSEPDEIQALPAMGVYAIDLNYKEARRRDEHGNWFRYRAKVKDAHGAQVGRWAWDVFFAIK